MIMGMGTPIIYSKIERMVVSLDCQMSFTERRVADVITAARQAEDTARKAAAHLLLWVFLALLIGAFCASYAATIGGRQRDHVKLI